MGYPVFYSDIQARSILDTHPEAIEKMTAVFGTEAYQHQKLNRPFIAEKVFGDQSLLQKLNAISHPLVRQSFDTWKNTQVSPVVFNEAAILFETGSYKNFDFTLLVTAPERVRVGRLLSRDQTDLQKIQDRIAAQWNDDQKIPLASFVLHNDDIQPLIPQLQKILQKIKL